MQWLLYFLLGKVFALTAGAYYFKWLPRPYRLVLYLTAIAIFCEWYGFYLHKYLKEQNAWLFNLYMPIEVWLMGIAGIYFLQNKNTKKFFIFLLFLNSIIWIVSLYKNTIYEFANLSMICGCILLTALYFLVLLDNSIFSTKGILKQHVFWLSLSSLLYFGGDIPFMGLHNYLSENILPVAKKLTIINDILDVIRYPLVAVCFILLGRQKISEIKTA